MKNRNIAIIGASYLQLPLIQKAKELGALTHFAKPFDIDDLRSTVREYIHTETV